ncbi:hypothetical protein MYAM1_001516 [Malassezia yamatoensis]|uniref:rRNA methyltransferase 2, mitochondrial n=1 Tax=Malassezia yamatoensis TaxID=253288 RepID=A0AAJ5YYI9_9BASI|nr:hypothetical protein MYAM1_001516 [Malassezia yamatoensis]
MCFRRWLAAVRGGSSARSYKLLQLDAKYGLLSTDRVVVDLGAAPGGWCQAVHTTSPMSRLFAVDLLPLKVTIPGIEYLRGDFTEEYTREKLRERITGSMDLKDKTHCVDVVLSDMMGMS